MSQPDHIHALGYLALGSRLKRISDTLYSACANFYQANHITFDPSNFPLLSLLDQEQELSITEAASALGLTHAAVSQKAAYLVKEGWAEMHADMQDKRSRRIRLSDDGKALVIKMQPLWYAIRQTQQDIGSEQTHPLLPLLDAFERGINDANLEQRMADHLRGYFAQRIAICHFTPSLAPHFESLNRQWIQEYFTLEPHDVKVLGNPQKYIIDRGGRVYFAMLDGEVVGTCALYPEASGSYEFTKMAMNPALRGKGIGRKLLQFVIDDARNSLNADRIYLLTSASLNPACHLYRSLGFVDIPLSREDKEKYQRADVKMEMWLNETARKVA